LRKGGEKPFNFKRKFINLPQKEGGKPLKGKFKKKKNRKRGGGGMRHFHLGGEGGGSSNDCKRGRGEKLHERPHLGGSVRGRHQREGKGETKFNRGLRQEVIKVEGGKKAEELSAVPRGRTGRKGGDLKVRKKKKKSIKYLHERLPEEEKVEGKLLRQARKKKGVEGPATRTGVS